MTAEQRAVDLVLGKCPKVFGGGGRPYQQGLPDDLTAHKLDETTVLAEIGVDLYAISAKLMLVCSRVCPYCAAGSPGMSIEGHRGKKETEVNTFWVRQKTAA